MLKREAGGLLVKVAQGLFLELFLSLHGLAKAATFGDLFPEVDLAAREHVGGFRHRLGQDGLGELVPCIKLPVGVAAGDLLEDVGINLGNVAAHGRADLIGRPGQLGQHPTGIACQVAQKARHALAGICRLGRVELATLSRRDATAVATLIGDMGHRRPLLGVDPG
jgi:hypothetical protein